MGLFLAEATAKQSLRVGVIGLGVGEQHVIGYGRVPGCEVAAICDIDPVKLAEVGHRQGIGTRHLDWKRITEDPAIDIVSICSYDDAHADQCISALQNGKHVMVEKPLALHRRDAERILRAQQGTGLRITSNLILRQVPRFRELYDDIRGGLYGDIFCIEGDYVHDILWKIVSGWRGQMNYYCTIYGGGIHLIDLMRWLVGDEVVEVSAMGGKVLTRQTAYRYDDTFLTLMRFAGGALAKNLTTFGPRRTKFHGLNVYGTHRTFINDLPHAKQFQSDRAEDEMLIKTPYPGVEKGDLIPGFVAAIRAGKEPDVRMQDVFRVMDICFAADEAARTGRATRLEYLI